VASGAEERQFRCSECGKSFRTETLLDYHNKYYHHHNDPHHVTAANGDSAGTTTSAVTSRRSSGSVDRGAAGRSRSKNKSTCKFTFLQPSL